MFPGWEIFGFQISTFGIMVGVGFLVGSWIAGEAFDRAGLDRDDAWKIVFWCAVGGLVGAKLWFVAEHTARGAGSIGDLLLSRGGLTWYGGFLGGTAGGLIRARTLGISAITAMNCSATTLAVGQAIGRIGCLLVGDDYGRPSDLPWAIAFPQGLPPTNVPVHPTMIYETLWLLPAALLLWRRRTSSPFVFGEYLVIAGIGRLWIEGLRLNPAVIGPFSNAQLVALACIVLGSASWVWFYRRGDDLSSRAPA